MTLEEAIKTAIGYEENVRDVYASAKEKATNDVGKRVFKVLAREEQGHIDFLYHKLKEWQNSGTITLEELETTIPSAEKIAVGITKLENQMVTEDRGDEAKMLEKAYKVEVETGNFYRKVSGELDGQGQKLFKRFVEIEEGHEAIVRAELDCVNGSGFWFDMPEFNLEAE